LRKLNIECDPEATQEKKKPVQINNKKRVRKVGRQQEKTPKLNHSTWYPCIKIGVAEKNGRKKKADDIDSNKRVIVWTEM